MVLPALSACLGFFVECYVELQIRVTDFSNQMWTAFGIMLGFVASVAFQNTDFLGPNTQWRWMLGSTSIPPFIVMCQVYLCPESPRW